MNTIDSKKVSYLKTTILYDPYMEVNVEIQKTLSFGCLLFCLSVTSSHRTDFIVQKLFEPTLLNFTVGLRMKKS